jgi:hypothetical protein
MFPLSLQKRYQVIQDGQGLFVLYNKSQKNININDYIINNYDDDDDEHTQDQFLNSIASIGITCCGAFTCRHDVYDLHGFSDQKILEIESSIKIIKVGIRFLPRLKKKLQGVRTRRLARLCILLAQCSLSKH